MIGRFDPLSDVREDCSKEVTIKMSSFRMDKICLVKRGGKYT